MCQSNLEGELNIPSLEFDNDGYPNYKYPLTITAMEKSDRAHY